MENQLVLVIKKDLPMDISLFVTYVFGTLFWLLLLACMALATIMFCGDNKDYDVLVRQSGIADANRTLCFFGFLSIGLPVLQAGQWLHGSVALAWVLVIVPAALWGLMFLLGWWYDD